MTPIKPSIPLSPDPCQVKEPDPIDLWVEEDQTVIVQDKDQLYRGKVNRITGPNTFSLTIDQLFHNGRWINCMSSYTWCLRDRIVNMEG